MQLLLGNGFVQVQKYVGNNGPRRAVGSISRGFGVGLNELARRGNIPFKMGKLLIVKGHDLIQFTLAGAPRGAKAKSVDRASSPRTARPLS